MAERPDYRNPGDIVEIPKLGGQWQRMQDDIRYIYVPGTRTRCPICLDDAAGVPWSGWFTCDSRGCCVALVETGEVFVRVKATAAGDGGDGTKLLAAIEAEKAEPK